MVLISLSLALAFALSAVVMAALAHDFGRRWIAEQAARRISDTAMTELIEKQALMNDVLGKLATDWRAKFVELERRLDTELQQAARSAGQPPPPRGFNRG